MILKLLDWERMLRLDVLNSRVIMLSRIDFNKGIRKVIGNYEEEK